MTVRKFLKAPGILAALGAFWASSCFINRVIPPAEGALGASFQNEVGWPIPWMTVYTSSDIRQFGVGSAALISGGNNGVHINLLALIAMVLLCLVVGGLVQWFVNWIRSKSPQPADPKPKKEGFWKVMGKLVHFLKAPGWLVAIAYWVTSPFSIMSVHPSAQRPGLYEYHLGLSQWLTVLDEEAGRTAWELFFSGNAGMGIHGTGQVLAFFLGYCLMGLAWGGLIQLLVNHLQDRRLDQGSQPQPHVEA